ncbi:MAG: hypothetical protein AMXMBFR13_16970 [Phycisphaerae bacterium]
MVVKAEGILRGGHIELEAPVTVLPEGARVSIELRPLEAALEEKKKLLHELAGAWADDSSLGPIFEEIDRRRHEASARPVNLDDPP